MVSRVSPLIVLVAATAQLSAQQSGVLSNPQPSPVQPDVVAFERIVNERGELVFIRISDGVVFSSTRQQPRPVRGQTVQLPGISIGQRLTSYAGQLDWRPRQGPNDNGNSWFAYVSSDEQGKVGLRLNYITPSGSLSDQSPLVIPFPEQVRSPRWSPDGRHLAVISERGILYTIPDIDQVMRSRNVSQVRPSSVNQATRPAFFPAWSPYGDHIAYSVEVTPRGGVRHGAIEVVPVVKATGRVDPRAVPVVVTAEMTGDNEYRPSWSPDAKFIAFYADQAGLGGTGQKVSIGLVEVITNARTGTVFRGEPREGKERWVADNVVPDEARGPAWSSLLEGVSEKSVLLYVERRAAGANAVVAAGLDRFLSKAPRAEYETEMSGGWNVANPKWITVAQLNQMVRYVFTSVANGGEVVGYRNQAASWSHGPDPTRLLASGLREAGGAGAPSSAFVATAAEAVAGGRAEPPAPAAPADNAIVIVHKGKDVSRALLFPGLGQYSAGNRGKGILLNVLGIVGAAAAVMGVSGMSGPRGAMNDAIDAALKDPKVQLDAHRKYDAALAAFKPKQSVFTAGAAVYTAAWLYGLLDVSLGSGGSGRFRIGPDLVPGEGGNTVQVRFGYSLPLGRAR